MPQTVLTLLAGLLIPAGSLAGPPPIKGDYDAELRRGDHVDVERLVRRLTELGANTYLWLIWHSPYDWEDLPTFLPLAKEAGINVWVYLVPHSETALENPRWPYSEPFRLDYVRWAQEIAKLSLQHGNLVGYVIDDFWANVRPDRFSPEYIKQMVAAGKAINPKLKFYPLMYYPEIGPAFCETVAPLVDGVVAAYPQDRQEIEKALLYLNDTFYEPSALEVVFPPHTASQPGDRGFASQVCEVTEADQAILRFRYRDSYSGPTAGYHFLQVRVDGETVWEEDVADADDGEAQVDLSRLVRDKRTFVLALGVYDKQGVSEYGLTATIAALQLTGLKLAQPELGQPEGWQKEVVGAFNVMHRPAVEGRRRFRLPLIVMPAGDRSEYAHRHREEATPERIARRVREALEMARAGQVEGVVLYCLNKAEGNPDFEAVKAVYREPPAQP